MKLLPIITIIFTISNWHHVGKSVDSLTPIIIGLLGIWLAIEHLELERFSRQTYHAFIYGVLAVTLLHSVIEPIGFSIVGRSYNQDMSTVHDGLVQLEIAAEKLSALENPYSVDYFSTRLTNWPYGSAGDINPALYHYAYLPILTVSHLVVGSLTAATIRIVDGRILFVIAYLLTLLISQFLSDSFQSRLEFFILYGLNPLTFRYLLNGRNDTLVFLWILTSLLMTKKGHFSIAALMLALATATKQSAWPLVPFFLVYWYQKSHPTDLSDKLRPLLVFILSLTVFIVPFVIWNPSNFVDATIFYPLGIGETAYPVSAWSYGIARLSFTPGKPIAHTAVFTIIKLITVPGLFIYLIRKLFRKPNLRHMSIFSTIFLFYFWYMNSFFHNNHVLFVIWIALASLTLTDYSSKSGLSAPSVNDRARRSF